MQNNTDSDLAIDSWFITPAVVKISPIQWPAHYDPCFLYWISQTNHHGERRDDIVYGSAAQRSQALLVIAVL